MPPLYIVDVGLELGFPRWRVGHVPFRSVLLTPASGVSWLTVLLILVMVARFYGWQGGVAAASSSINSHLSGCEPDLAGAEPCPTFAGHRGHGRQEWWRFLPISASGEQGIEAASMGIFGSSSSTTPHRRLFTVKLLILTAEGRPLQDVLLALC